MVKRAKMSKFDKMLMSQPKSVQEAYGRAESNANSAANRIPRKRKGK